MTDEADKVGPAGEAPQNTLDEQLAQHRRGHDAAIARRTAKIERLAEDLPLLVKELESDHACTERLYFMERAIQTRACYALAAVLGEPVLDVRVGAEKVAALVAELRARPAGPPPPPSTGLPLLDFIHDAAIRGPA